MTLTPAQRKAALARVNKQAEAMLVPLEWERQATAHEARARALQCWRDHHDLGTVAPVLVSENQRREKEHRKAAEHLHSRVRVRRIVENRTR